MQNKEVLMGQSPTPKALALGVSISLACGLLPGAAFAEESPSDDASSSAEDAAPTGAAAKPTGYDKAEFYSEAASPLMARSFAAPLSLSPLYLSDEMKYFAKYESNQNYDQGLSWGDGYHAMGYYQFDNRYSLKSFIMACYSYDPVKYSMFAWVADTDISGELYDEDAGKLTSIGQQLNDSWHAAYNAHSEEFAALQDSYAYNSYYVPAENYLASRGIDISNRADCVKGLCWGLANLFGTSGWHKFVGGWSDGYVDGVYYNSYNYPGAGLTNDMSDEQFVSTLCDYVVANVGEFYAGQPLYHEGWQNRYVHEKATCLSYLANKPTVTPPATPPETVVPPVEPTPPTDNSGDSDGSETESPEPTPPTGGTEKPEPGDTEDPEEPGDTTTPPPANNGNAGDSGNEGDQGGSNNTVEPNEPTDTTEPSGETTPPSTDSGSGNAGDGTDAGTEKSEVIDESTNNLEDPTTTANQQPRDLPKPENDESNGAQSGTSKSSNLSQTGDGTTKAPLGAALVSAGVAAVAGAALVTRRIVK